MEFWSEGADLLLDSFDAFYIELKTSRFNFSNKTVVATIFVLFVFLSSIKFHWISKALHCLTGCHSNAAKTSNLKPETTKRINSPKNPANSLVLHQNRINQDKEKSSAQQKNPNAFEPDCTNNDFENTKISKNLFKNFMLDDLNLRRELLATQQKLIKKTKQVQSLEKSLQNTKQSMLNNSSVLAGRNHSSQYDIPKRISNITRRASFFSSTFVDNQSIKSDSFEDIISEKDEVINKIQHSKEQTLKFFEKIQDLSKELKQTGIDGFLNQQELISLRDIYEQALQSSNDLEYLMLNGIEKIEKLKNLFTLPNSEEDKDEKAEDDNKTKCERYTDHDYKNLDKSQLIHENSELRNAMAGLAIKLKRLQEELGRAEEERESFQFEIKTLQSALDHQKRRVRARIVKPVKPRRSRSCSGADKIEVKGDDQQAPVITIND